MNIKTMFIKSGVAVLMLLFVTKISFAQQQKTIPQLETVVYKLQKSDYAANGNALQTSLQQVNGVAVTKFCDKYNKIFMILQVNRTLQPNDNNIVSALNTVSVGYKKVESNNIQNILTFCN
ncbi:MAG TPA: hypothetical protein VJY62_10120 [Bacteroidia bacterium]|nr:hypothetical protein [Bacteroidia bacterium]